MWYLQHQRQRAYERAAAVQKSVRVVRPLPVELVVGLLGSLFSTQDSVDTIRQLCIGEGTDCKTSRFLPVFPSSHQLPQCSFSISLSRNLGPPEAGPSQQPGVAAGMGGALGLWRLLR